MSLKIEYIHACTPDGIEFFFVDDNGKKVDVKDYVEGKNEEY